MAVLGAVSLIAAVSLAPAAPVARPSRVMPLSAVEHQLLEKYQHAHRRHQEGKLSAQEFAEVIETQVLPTWRAARQSFDKVDDRRIAAGERDWLNQHKRYMLLREQAWEATAGGLKENDPRRLQEAKEKNAAAERLQRQVDVGQ
jgi:hypothetical protein